MSQTPIRDIVIVGNVETVIAECVAVMPTHAEFIAAHSAARTPA